MTKFDDYEKIPHHTLNRCMDELMTAPPPPIEFPVVMKLDEADINITISLVFFLYIVYELSPMTSALHLTSILSSCRKLV